MDGRVLLFLAAVTVLTSIAFGLTPALQASRRDAADALKEGGRDAARPGAATSVVRHVFVAAQVAVAFILLVGGGLLMRSFHRVMDVDTGYDTEGIVAAYLPLPMERDPEPRGADAVHPAAARRGARRARRPGRGGGHRAFRSAAGATACRSACRTKPDEIVGTGFKIVTPGYFRTLGLRLIAGRLLDERDTAGSVPVVVVNESFVRRYFAEQESDRQRILVERILPSRRGLGPQTAWEIVGVVVDEKASGLESPTDVGAYASFAQNPVVGLGIVAQRQRRSGDADQVDAAARCGA